MSDPEQAIVLSVKKLEVINKEILENDVVCYLFLNSCPISVIKVSDADNSVLVSAKSPEDSLQLIFRKSEKNESIGYVSFEMKYFIQSNSNQVTQWVPLSDDPTTDKFDGSSKEDNDGHSKALIHFTVINEEGFASYPEPSIKKSFELYLKEKQLPPNCSFQQKESTAHDSEKIDDFGGQTLLSEVDTHLKMQLNFEVDSKAHFEDANKSLSVTDLIDEKASIAFEKENSSHKKTEPFEVLTPQDLNRDTTWKQDSETRKEIKESTFKVPIVEEDGVISSQHILALEQQNVILANRVNELHQKVLELENKNSMLRQSEEASNTKLHHLKIDLEKLRFKTESYETLVAETEQELLETKDHLKLETATKVQFLKEKEELALLLKQAKDAQEAAKNGSKELKARDVVDKDSFGMERRISIDPSIEREEVQSINKIRQYYEEILRQKEQKHKEEKEELERGSVQLKQEVKLLKAQIQDDEKIIQNLQREIFASRQKEEENTRLGLSEKLRETEEKVRFYEEKTKNFVEMCSNCLFKDIHLQFGSIEEFINKAQEEIIHNKQEIQELKVINEGLEMKLSISDNKLLADTLWAQINDFKDQIHSFEKERENHKTELFKANENYTKLINKYTELTEVLASLQQPTIQKTQPQKSIQKVPSGTLSKNIYSKLSSRNTEIPDEIEAKLTEFLTNHKIQPSPFVRVEKGVYTYNGRKIMLKVLNGKLVVKGTSGYKPLQDFLRDESGTRTPPRSTKSNTRSEGKSFDSKYKRDKLELINIQLTDHTRRDLTPESVSSMSFYKDTYRDTTPKDFDTRPLLTEPSRNDSKDRPPISEQVKLKDLIASRSVERRVSYNIGRSGQKNQRDVTLF